MVGVYWVAPNGELNVVSSTGPPAATASRPEEPPPELEPVTVTDADPVQVSLARGELASVWPLIVMVRVPAVEVQRRSRA